MTIIIFVRHGQTTWNVEGRVQGGGDIDAMGLAQVTALADRLRGEKLAAVYASPTDRTRQTAALLAGSHGLPVTDDADLVDLHYGDYSGAYLPDAIKKDPELWERFKTAPHTVRFPGGESLADLRARVQRFLTRMARQHPGGTVLAVTHDSPIRVATSMALGLDDSYHTTRDIVTPLASPTRIEVTSHGVKLLEHPNDLSRLERARA